MTMCYHIFHKWHLYSPTTTWHVPWSATQTINHRTSFLPGGWKRPSHIGINKDPMEVHKAVPLGHSAASHASPSEAKSVWRGSPMIEGATKWLCHLEELVHPERFWSLRDQSINQNLPWYQLERYANNWQECLTPFAIPYREWVVACAVQILKHRSFSTSLLQKMK